MDVNAVLNSLISYSTLYKNKQLPICYYYNMFGHIAQVLDKILLL